MLYFFKRLERPLIKLRSSALARTYAEVGLIWVVLTLWTRLWLLLFFSIPPKDILICSLLVPNFYCDVKFLSLAGVNTERSSVEHCDDYEYSMRFLSFFTVRFESLKRIGEDCVWSTWVFLGFLCKLYLLSLFNFLLIVPYLFRTFSAYFDGLFFKKSFNGLIGALSGSPYYLGIFLLDVKADSFCFALEVIGANFYWAVKLLVN